MSPASISRDFLSHTDMDNTSYAFGFSIFDSIEELTSSDAALLAEARMVSENAYAPYSRFKVGAVGRLTNGELVAGTNQENAASPAGLCAERVLLGTVSSRFPGVAIDTIAISYKSTETESTHPISPCGICRQSILEFEERFDHPIRLILGGQTGKVYVIPDAAMLLPLSFSSRDLHQ